MASCLGQTSETNDSCSRHSKGNCITDIKSAPSVRGFTAPEVGFARKAMSEWIKKVYLKNGDPCPTCAVHFSFYDEAMQHVDYAVLEKNIRLKLNASGQQISFNGTSSDELLITTKPVAKADGKRYYQVVIIGNECRDNRGCDVFGSATQLVFSGKDKESSVTDPLCEDIENYLSDYFYELLIQYASKK